MQNLIYSYFKGFIAMELHLMLQPAYLFHLLPLTNAYNVYFTSSQLKIYYEHAYCQLLSHDLHHYVTLSHLGWKEFQRLHLPCKPQHMGRHQIVQWCTFRCIPGKWMYFKKASNFHQSKCGSVGFIEFQTVGINVMMTTKWRITRNSTQTKALWYPCCSAS